MIAPIGAFWTAGSPYAVDRGLSSAGTSLGRAFYGRVTILAYADSNDFSVLIRSFLRVADHLPENTTFLIRIPALGRLCSLIRIPVSAGSFARRHSVSSETRWRSAGEQIRSHSGRLAPAIQRFSDLRPEAVSLLGSPQETPFARRR